MGWVSCVVFVFFCTFKANGKLAKPPGTLAVTGPPACRKLSAVQPKELLPMLLVVVRGGTAQSIRKALTFARELRKFNDKIC